MLFKEYTYFNHQFPEPQYLGAKTTHLGWIKKFIPEDIETVLDAFSGSQSVAYLFKQMGLKTITNDFLNFNHQIGLSLIENKSEVLDSNDLDLLFKPAKNKDDFKLIENIYTGVFFEQQEAIFLDNLRANIPLLDSKYKQSLSYAIVNRSMTRKVTMGHFGHTQALKYASNPERIKRNRSLVRPLKDIFVELTVKYNSAVFDNGKDNTSYNKNIIDLLPHLNNIDLVYFDPPYCNSHADYQSFYHLLETYTEYWSDKEFINTIKRYDPQRHSGFDKKRDVIKSFEQLFNFSKDIPYWLISYNNRSYPSIDELEKIISKYKNVQIEEKIYVNGRGGKGSVAGSKEVLFVCKPKTKHLVTSIKKEFAFDEKF
ncbi:MAG: DNA methyltransferase [Bacteroidetes bacterium]|nr:MAG: DNA methyltransferase [Bacteroidota bacterium]